MRACQRVLFLLSLPLLAHGLDVRAETPAVAPAGPKIAGAPALQGAVYSIFDNRTGARTGRINIERVDFEYRRQGFMVLAWQPRVVLEGVEITLEAGLDWPTQGNQILRALASHGRREEVVLRRVRLRLAAPEPRELVAAEAIVTPTGALELLHATDTRTEGASAQSFLLPLTGPSAGQLQPQLSRRPRPVRDGVSDETPQN